MEVEASVLMQRMSYPTETVLSNKIIRIRIVLSFKDFSHFGKKLRSHAEVRSVK